MASFGTRADVGGGPFVLDAPVARNPDGSDVVGPSLEEFVIDDDRTSVERLTYPAAKPRHGQGGSHIPRRVDDEPTPVRADQWRYDAGGASISLLPEGMKFKPGMLSTDWSIRPRTRRSPDWQFRGDARPRRVPIRRRGTTRDIRIPSPAPCGGSTPPGISALPVHARLRGARVQRGSRATSDESGRRLRRKAV